MPFPKKFTSAQISRLYDEYVAQDKDLKTFLTEKGLEEHYNAIRARFDRLDKRLAKGLPPIEVNHGYTAVGGRDVAEDEVATTVQQEIAAESKQKTQQHIILGKKIWEAFAAHAAKKGIDLSKLREMPIHEVVMDALEKADEYDKLRKDYEEVVEKLNFYQSRTDPVVRMELAIDMLRKFLETAILLDQLGVDILESEAGEYYGRLIEDFLLGRKSIGQEKLFNY